jgi:aminoglycoside/choline kinase family phosphotransferase
MNPVLKQWLQQNCTFPIDSLQEIPGDASFRRYFRLASGKQSYMVMDASQQRDCFEPFVAISRALHALGVTVPEVLVQDLTQGYMLISDFGDTQYLTVLALHNADRLYKTALNSLSLLQTCSSVADWTIPSFDSGFMQRELSEFNHWFLEGYLKCSFSPVERKLLQTTFTALSEAASRQPQVFMHRDYHSANLMVLKNEQVGILDFQDACIGPVTYDLVSLLRDCYIDWPDEKVEAWVAYYYELLREQSVLNGVSQEQFMTWFDWMGMQRHMKALFIFARKYLRDHTPRYLQFMPRTLNYLAKVSGRYPELGDFHRYVENLNLPLEKIACEA